MELIFEILFKKLQCVIQGARGWDDPEGWNGEGSGSGGVQDREHMYTYDGFMSMYGNTNTVF